MVIFWTLSSIFFESINRKHCIARNYDVCHVVSFRQTKCLYMLDWWRGLTPLGQKVEGFVHATWSWRTARGFMASRGSKRGLYLVKRIRNRRGRSSGNLMNEKTWKGIADAFEAIFKILLAVISLSRARELFPKFPPSFPSSEKMRDFNRQH